jgi:hypothetical protein
MVCATLATEDRAARTRSSHCQNPGRDAQTMAIVVETSTNSTCSPTISSPRCATQNRRRAIQRLDERLNSRVAGTHHLGRRVAGDELAIIDHTDAASQRECLGHVVRHQDHRRLELSLLVKARRTSTG